jgi:prepilin-type N-terminal cleavage/methylation domain-containing protein
MWKKHFKIPNSFVASFRAARPAFSLVEVLVALMIFGIIATVGMNTFITTYRATQSSNVENVLLEDARYIMARLKAEIAQQNIDYEEYFSNLVMQSDKDQEDRIYGQNHGYYAWQFYNGGKNPGNNREDGLGSLCQLNDGTFKPLGTNGCITGSLAESEDNSTGRFPASHRILDPTNEVVETTNAFCVTSDPGAEAYSFLAQVIGNNNCTELTLADHFLQEELYLVNKETTQKTIIRAKTVTIDNQEIQTLALSRLNEVETTGAVKKFTCAPEYPCENLDDDDTTLEPSRVDSERNLFEDFLPITPLRTNIKSVKFLITPLENPELAFTENFSSVRIQPQVTILLTVEPIDRVKALFGRKNLELSLQTTVTTRVQ